MIRKILSKLQEFLSIKFEYCFYCCWKKKLEFYLLPTIRYDHVWEGFWDTGFYWLNFRIGCFWTLKE
jgi:hypothetical protein